MAGRTLERRTPLGVLCWDPVQDHPVEEGLHLTLAPLDAPECRFAGLRTPRGIHVFHDLPGLRDWENAIAPLRPGPGGQREFVLQIEDVRGRFLPVATKVSLPWSEQRLFLSSLVRKHADDEAPGFYLFSAPTRRAQPNLAVLRGQLRDSDTGAPASWALLELQTGASAATRLGMADKRGCVGLLFPYPEPLPSPPTSPSLDPVLTDEWGLTLRIRYGPDPLRQLPGTKLPDIRDIVAQPYALIEAREGQPWLDETHLTLSLGRELVLRTVGTFDVLPWLNVSAGLTSP